MRARADAARLDVDQEAGDLLSLVTSRSLVTSPGAQGAGISSE